MSSAIALNQPYLLENFLDLKESDLPVKGALLEIHLQDEVSKVKHVVFDHVEYVFCKTPPIRQFFGRAYKKKILVGLDLHKDFEIIMKYGKGFYGETQLVELSSFHRLLNPVFTSCATIEIKVNNYFEHIRLVRKELEDSLNEKLLSPCVRIVKEYVC